MGVSGGRALDVIVALAVSDFRLKYYGSFRGYAWSMLSPLLMLATYYLVFRHVVGVAMAGYLPYLLVGIVYWTFFQDCTYSGRNAFVARAAVLKALPVPAWLVVAGSGASTLITLGINTVVLAVVLLVSGDLSPRAPAALVPIACLVALAAGVSLLVAVAHVRFPDTGLLWGIALQAWFWLTPIVYSTGGGRFADMVQLNPLARCLEWIRGALLGGAWPGATSGLVTVASCAAVLAAGIHLLQRQAPTLPERL
jgi:ABC-type polysaccharide/polyol phosphate export permease